MRKTRKFKKKGGWWWSRKGSPKIETEEEKNERERIKKETLTNSTIFIDTCKDIFMTEPLSMVSKISWMQKDDCNIFLIGEYHGINNERCKGIFESFKQLINEIFIKKTNFEIDILLEIKENETKFISQSKNKNFERPKDNTLIQFANDDINDINDLNANGYRDAEGHKRKEAQINLVRYLLASCIERHDCSPFKIHWTDANGMITPLKQKDASGNVIKDASGNEITVKKKDKYGNVIKDASGNEITVKKGLKETFANLAIHSENLNAKKLVTTLNGSKNAQYNYIIQNFLLDHDVVMKEIKKATIVNPTYTVNFVKDMFSEIINENYKIYNYHNVFILFRHVIDFYTVARLISQKMKNVIIYQGGLHTDFIIRILKRLKFNDKIHIDQTKDDDNIKCFENVPYINQFHTV